MILLLIFLFVPTYSESICNLRSYPNGDVCVCNSKNCDTVPQLTKLNSGDYQIYTTSKSSMGFNTNTSSFSQKKSDSSPIRILINPSKKHQKIIGFGGAFTDSTGMNIASLPNDLQEILMENYFGESGIGYNLCRVPIGGTDFSVRFYSYDDSPGDNKLEKFKLQPEDTKYKVPYIKMANKLRGDKKLKLFGTAWTAPPWMKTNNAWQGGAYLKLEYYQTWANYHIRFFEEYQKQGIDFWGLTTGNEPTSGSAVINTTSMAWTSEQMNAYIGNNLGPTLRNSKFRNLKIMLYDDISLNIYTVVIQLSNKKTAEYADGIAFHWYSDKVCPISDFEKYAILDKQDWFMLQTESCIIGDVSLGNWTRAEKYLNDLFNVIEADITGWVDWNMVLDPTGGPTVISNFVDAAIIVNSTAQEFYKQPLFYALGHFSKFVLPDSIRIEAVVKSVNRQQNVKALGFLRPDGLTSVLIYNKHNDKVEVTVEENLSVANIVLPAHSITTLIYKP